MGILLSTSEKYTSTILCMILLQRPRHSQPDPGSNLWIISNHKRSYFITGTTVMSFKVSLEVYSYLAWLQHHLQQLQVRVNISSTLSTIYAAYSLSQSIFQSLYVCNLRCNNH